MLGVFKKIAGIKSKVSEGISLVQFLLHLADAADDDLDKNGKPEVVDIFEGLDALKTKLLAAGKLELSHLVQAVKIERVHITAHVKEIGADLSAVVDRAKKLKAHIDGAKK